MEFADLDDTIRDYRASIRSLAQERVAPHAAAVDAESRYPEESYQALASAGVLSLPYPEKWGGQEAGLMIQLITIEELARVCSTTALSVFATWGSLDAAVKYGNTELLDQIVPAAARGELVGSFALTEPRSGSDLAGLTTTAVRDGDGWVLSGTKRFITNAGRAQWYSVLARTGEGSYGVFLVNKDDEGVSFGAPEKKMGLRGSPTGDVILSGVSLAANRVVGDGADGYQCMMQSLTYTRPIVAAQALGVAQGALDEAVRYTRERTAFGSPVMDYQLVKGMVADMAVKVEAARALLYRCVPLVEAGDPKARSAVSMAKLFATDSAMAVTTDAVQLHGGYGYLQDYPVERMMRDAKIMQIYEGTNQIQRLLIAKSVYGG